MEKNTQEWMISKIGNNYDEYSIYSGDQRIATAVQGKANAELIAAAPETAGKLEEAKEKLQLLIDDSKETTERFLELSGKLVAIAAERDRLKEALKAAMDIIDRMDDEFRAAANKHSSYTKGEDNKLKAALNGESAPAQSEGGIPLPADYVDFNKIGLTSEGKVIPINAELLEALDDAYNLEMSRKDEARNFENSTLKNWKKIIQQARKLV